MKRLLTITVLALAGIALSAVPAEAQFFRFGFGGFFRPRNNIQINNFNGGGFNGNRVFVNNGFRSFGGGNRVVVNNGFNRGFNGGFVNRGFGGNRVFVNNGFNGNRVFINNGYGGNRVLINGGGYSFQPAPLFIQPQVFVNDVGYGGCGVGVSSFGYGGFAVRRFSCY